MPALNAYATRVQSFLQQGRPDNEVLLYFPIHDIWQTWRKGHYVTFDIHRIGEKLPNFEKIVFDIRRLGYDLDYISDQQILEARVDNHQILPREAISIRLSLFQIVITAGRNSRKVIETGQDGATIAFLDRLPDDVPGLSA
jgi:hypothetical protein